MPTSPPIDEVHLRRADTNERFVAFAFAGAELLAEIDLDGVLTYAAGAFRSRFGQPPDAFVGRTLKSLIAAVDHEALDAAMLLLTERGRLAPMMVRMNDPDRTRLALAGIAMPTQGRPARLCLSFARPPSPVRCGTGTSTAAGFARATEARLRAGTQADMSLLEIAGTGAVTLLQSEAIGQAIDRLVPNALTSELAPGRFGLMGGAEAGQDMGSFSASLAAILHAQGIDVAVTARPLSLSSEGLTPTQAARALRHALLVFARGGARGLLDAGINDSLADYMHQAARKTETLRRAIRGGQFSLAFQPIVTLGNRAPHHWEALIRPAPIPDLPLGTPQEFVMMVEALGLADELDLAVARVTCAQAARAGVPIAFNLSGQSAQDPAFRGRLVEMLSESLACKAGLVIVEMTESAELENIEEAVQTADALRRLGITFCLDDFGAGSTDMRVLRALGANIVKLDGSYVPGIALAGRERAFVAGMVDIARAVGAEIVAERVETESEAAALGQLGVQYGQGWLFGRPGPLPRDAARLVSAGSAMPRPVLAG
jgi:EAL domain-containing protein (putative c-di-GMP-specific phosphodiesterase class I)